MAQAPGSRINPIVAFIAGGVVVLAVVLLALAWSHAATSGLKLVLEATPDIPSMPRLPDAPKLPDAPVPAPK